MSLSDIMFAQQQNQIFPSPDCLPMRPLFSWSFNTCERGMIKNILILSVYGLGGKCKKVIFHDKGGKGRNDTVSQLSTLSIHAISNKLGIKLYGRLGQRGRSPIIY